MSCLHACTVLMWSVVMVHAITCYPLPFKNKIIWNLYLHLHIFLVVCWSLSSHSRSFHSYGDVTITGERLQILTDARHSWPLSNEGYLTCHTYCDTGLPFIMVIRDTHTCCRAFATVNRSATGVSVTCPPGWPLYRVDLKQRRCDTLKNPHCSVTMSAEYMSKLVTLNR